MFEAAESALKVEALWSFRMSRPTALSRLFSFERHGLGPVVVLALVLLVFASIELVAGALLVGVTTDEPVHSTRTQGLLDSGWYVPGYLLENGVPGSSELANPFVYGPGFSMPSHLLATIAGIETPGIVSEESLAWQFRHLILALIALLTVGAVAICVETVTGSRGIALWAAAALICTPIWLGMGMFNIKDLPVAAGYTFFTTGLVVALAARTPLAGRRFGVVVALCAGGILLSVGVRFAMWAPILISVVVWFALVFLRHRSNGVPARGKVQAMLFGTAIGMAITIALYPSAFSDPFEWLRESVSASSAYPFTGSTLTFGTLLSSNPPPIWYLPVWTFAVVPLLIGALALVGIGAWLIRMIRSIRSSSFGRFATGRHSLLILVIAQLLLLPAGAMILGSTIYDGLRQHLYVIPPIAILAGYGFASIWRSDWVKSAPGPLRRRIVVIVACLAISVPFIQQSFLFPYNYTFINPVAGIGGANGRWETDFWWASGREAAGRVPAGATVACSRYLEAPVFTECGKNQVAQYLDPETIPFDPVSPTQDEVWVLAWKRAGNQPPEFCRVEDGVQRWLRGEQVVMSWVMRCPADRVAASYQSIG